MLWKMCPLLLLIKVLKNTSVALFGIWGLFLKHLDSEAQASFPKFWLNVKKKMRFYYLISSLDSSSYTLTFSCCIVFMKSREKDSRELSFKQEVFSYFLPKAHLHGGRSQYCVSLPDWPSPGHWCTVVLEIRSGYSASKISRDPYHFWSPYQILYYEWFYDFYKL